MKKTIVDAVIILLFSLCIALLYHALSPSGIVIFKKKQGGLPAPRAFSQPGGASHG